MTMATFSNTGSNPIVPIDGKKCSNRSGDIPLPLSSSSKSTIELELQQLRGELFDISDTDSSVAIILTKVQQLTEFENRIVEEQRLEIERLSVELNELRIQQHQHRSSGMFDGLESLPSFGNIAEMVSSNSSTTSSSSSSSSSSAGCTNESERETSYSLFANEKLATKANDLTIGITETNYSKEFVSELEKKIRNYTDELKELSNWKEGIVSKIEEITKQSQCLLTQRNKLIQEVEVYTHQSELAIQLECAQAENIRLQHEIMEIRATENEKQHIYEDKLMTAEREKARVEDMAATAEDRARTEEMIRKEMESQMQSLYKEKIALQKEFEDWKLTTRGDVAMATSTAAIGGEDIQRLKEEIQALRGENASLRSTANRGCGEIAASHDESTTEQSASRKRTLVNSQGYVGEEDERSRVHKRHHERANTIGCLELIDGSTKVRSNTDGSDTLDGDLVRARHEADSVSLLFGPSSVDGLSRKPNLNNINADSVPFDDCISGVKSTSDHDVIRAHAEKVLYWANKAAERSKSGCSPSSSVVSTQEVKERRGDDESLTTPHKREASPPSSSPIPATIGLPPRSQTRVRKSSQLPPRCPPSSTSATPSLTSSSSSGEVETLDCNSSSSSSNKENGGSTFNRDSLGAFPTLSPKKHSHRQQKKHDRVAENDSIIHNLNTLNAVRLCCECSASPFSGNDPESEFYLPKLGLACNCAGASIIEERESFSKNPTALSNILRSWQCAFLETLSITTADELLNAHRAGANTMARKMKNWRAMQGGMKLMRSRECFVALKVWSCTCKVVLRSIKEQKEQALRKRSRDDHAEEVDSEKDIIIEKPHFLDISFADMHTITSISTLGQFSSECGRPFEMMEI